MKTNTREEIEEIIKKNTSLEWGEDYSYNYFDKEPAIDQILALLEKENKEARWELYEAFDAKYKDFELTRALGEVLRELEKEE